MVLVPEVVDAIAPLPVLAAGGIANGRQMAAAMALGAAGVWTGSVWLTTNEAETRPVVKQKFIDATSADTVRSRAARASPRGNFGLPGQRRGRSVHTEPLPMPLHSMLVGEARHRIDQAALGDNQGARTLVNYFVGQVVGSATHVRSAHSVVMSMVDEYIDAVSGLGSSLDGSSGERRGD